MFHHRNITSICTLLLVLCLLLSGCSGKQADTATQPEQTSNNAYTFTDALGQEITVDHPQRVVSLMGSFSEIWVDMTLWWAPPPTPWTAGIWACRRISPS